MEGIPGGPVVRTPLSLPKAWVLSLVGELRSHMPQDIAKKKKKKCGERKKQRRLTLIISLNPVFLKCYHFNVY